MVCDWGMSKKIGPLKFGKKDEEVFLGKELSQQKNYSEEKSILIDSEISSLVKNAEVEADNIFSKFKNQLDDIAKELLDKEVSIRCFGSKDQFNLSLQEALVKFKKEALPPDLARAN